MWVQNNCDCTTYLLEQYYPGASYVNWVGVDAYNFGNTQTWASWTSPVAMLDPWINRLKVYGKPIAIPEWGTTTYEFGANNVSAKNQWLREFFGYASDKCVVEGQ